LSAFTSYGAFWMSFATILIPGSGIVAAYADPQEFRNALGIYLMTWFIVTFILLYVAFCPLQHALSLIFCFRITALRKSVAFIALFGFLSLAFILLGAANFMNSTAYVPFITSR
jgi:uncharacterized protein